MTFGCVSFCWGVGSPLPQAMLGGEVVFNADDQLQLAATLVGVDKQLDRKVAVLPGSDFVNSQDLELAAVQQSVKAGRRHIVRPDLRVAGSRQDRHTPLLGVFLLDQEARGRGQSSQ